MSYYKIINGIRYNRDLLDAAETFTQGRSESNISFKEIHSIYQIALDGKAYYRHRAAYAAVYLYDGVLGTDCGRSFQPSSMIHTSENNCFFT